MGCFCDLFANFVGCVYMRAGTFYQPAGVNRFGRFQTISFYRNSEKSIGLVLLFCALVFFNQVFWVAVSVMITQLVSLILQSRPVARIIAYPLSEQGKDVLVPLLFSLAMAFPILLLKQLQWNIWLKFFAKIFAGGAVYIFLAVLTQNPELKILVRYVSQTYRKLTHKEGNIA